MLMNDFLETMKSRKKLKKLRITEADFMLANRRAARAEDMAEHGGRPVSFRTVLHKSKKVYDRKRLKRAGIKLNDDCPFRVK
jgi:hypothetical protein